jgi:hypothetical protein
MPPTVQQYTDEIHDELGYWATWLPGVKLRLGDIGRIRDRVFTPEGSLERLGLPVTDDGESLSDIQHATRGAVAYRVQTKADTQAIPHVPQGSAGIALEFSRENAVVLVVRDAVERRLADVSALERRLTELVNAGEFDPEYAVVTHVVTAGTATVLISRSADSRVELSAKADLSLGLLDLASADAQLSRVGGSGMETEILARRGLTPLFKLVGFKRRGVFLGRPRVGRLHFEDEDVPASLSEVIPGDADDDAPCG